MLPPNQVKMKNNQSQIEIKLSDGSPVKVAKLPIGKYAELLRAFRELPKKVAGLDKLDNETIIAQLPNLVEQALPEFLDMLAVATPLKSEDLAKLGLDEIIDLTLAVVEVNRYKQVFDKIKKALARPEATATTN